MKSVFLERGFLIQAFHKVYNSRAVLGWVNDMGQPEGATSQFCYQESVNNLEQLMGLKESKKAHGSSL